MEGEIREPRGGVELRISEEVDDTVVTEEEVVETTVPDEAVAVSAEE